MKRKGYVFGLAVFFVFATVILMAATNIKTSQSVRDSTYDSLVVLKAGRFADNIRTLKNKGMTCLGLERGMTDDLAFDLEFECSPVRPNRAYLKISYPGTLTKDYMQTIYFS